MSTGTGLTMSPEDILKFQNDLVRTGKALPLGRIKMISIGPNDGCAPLPTWDPIMKKYGRLMQLRDMPLPIAHSPDRSMILVTAPLLDRQGRVRLPDLPDPSFVPENFTPEEVTGRVARPASKDSAPFIEQSLRMRADSMMLNSNFYVFSPVLSISFQ